MAADPRWLTNWLTGGCYGLEKSSTPGWTRTSDPGIRNPMLYPPELRARVFQDIFYHRAEGSAKRGRSQSRVAWDVRAARIPLLALRAWMKRESVLRPSQKPLQSWNQRLRFASAVPNTTWTQLFSSSSYRLVGVANQRELSRPDTRRHFCGPGKGDAASSVRHDTCRPPWRQVFNLSVSPVSIPQVKNSWPRAELLRVQENRSRPSSGPRAMDDSSKSIP